MRAHRGGMAALLAAALAAATLTATATAQAAAPTTAPTPAAAAAAPTGLLSAQQASARARSTGKPVEVTSLTSETSLTEANPNGTLTLTESALPSRVRQHGKWTNLDATLKANPDGTLSPAASLNQVVLSGGGAAPLASLYSGGQGLSLTLPITLPHPKLSGPSAVYADVLPGVDLTVTVQTSGAVSDVFTVRTPAAARDPRLASLLTSKTTTTRGLKVQSDAAGDLAVTDPAGRPLYTAPAARAWDSATAPAPTQPPAGGITPQAESQVQAESQAQAATADRAAAAGQTAPTSTFGAPGRNAHVATLKVAARPGSIALAAPSALLTGPGTVWPVFLDPTFSPEYGNTGWSSPGSGVGGDSYWKKSVSYSGDAEVGNSGDVQGEAMSLFDFPVDLKTLRGAKIYDAVFGIKEDYSWACPTSGHNQTVNFYAPSGTLTSSNATWNAWVSNLGSSVDSHSFALGYNSSCPANYTPTFEVKDQIINDISTSKGTQTLVMRAADHSDNYAFKQFDTKTAQLTVTYDQYPNTPAGLYTSPATHCSGTTLGDTSVTLYAPVSTVTKAHLTTTFHLYKTSDTAKTNLLTSANGIASDTYGGASGQVAVLTPSEAFYKAQAGGAATSFSWIAQTTDSTLTSAWSAPCTFTWDPTRPGAPTITPNPSPPADAVTCPTLDVPAGTIQAVGSTCSFNFAPPTGSTTVSGYIYQVNQDAPQTVSATTGATVSVRLQRLVNTLTVSALSPGGNLGSPVTTWFDGSPLSPAAKDGDLTGDGFPDLIVPGNASTALPPGLWLAGGGANGTVAPNGTNIGANGLGINTATVSPGDWNGAQAVTGDFCGYGEQDVLAYFPTGANAGGGSVVCNDGSSGSLRLGDPTDAGSDSAPFVISAGSFEDESGNTATQVATAGNTSGKGTGIPDVLATVNNRLVLFYAQSPNGYTGDSGFDPMCVDGGCFALSALNTPDGTQDWNSWTIATAQLSSGTALYLWNATTGALDLWTGLSLSTPTGTTLATTGQYTIYSSGWNAGASRILRAADFSGNGIPDLWATDPTTGSTTALVLPSLTNNPTIVPGVPSTPSTATHAWQLNDYGADATAPTTAADDTSGTPLNLTGSSGVSANTGDAFSPDVDLIAAEHDSLTTSTKAVDLTKDFTVSAWADPTAYGAVLSQEGTADSGLRLLATSSGWKFSLNTGAGTAAAYDDVIGGSVQLGSWTHLTATYNHTTKTMNLYVHDVLVATGTHTAPATGAGAAFRVGADQNAGAVADYFTGRLAQVKTWSAAALPPAQPYTPASYHQSVTATRVLDTRTATGPGVTNTSPKAPVGASSIAGGTTTALQISGLTVAPISGTAVRIPNSVTAVAIDVTVAAQTGSGFVTAYADGTQHPLTSSTNYTANNNTTGYQIVPVGADGRIDLYNAGSSSTTVALIVDVTGYFTSDAGLVGDQTYTPLPVATRALDTRTSVANTNLHATGLVAAGSSFTLQIGNTDGVPATASAVALNLTAVGQDGNGFLDAYPAGAAQPTLTSLTYTTANAIGLASTAADVPLSSTGAITIANHSSNTDVIVDISGYYTTDTSGQKFHAVNPTRMVDTRNGTGANAVAPMPPMNTYVTTPASTQQITTATTPTLITMLTVTNTAQLGTAVFYPTGTTKPGTSNLNWNLGTTAANLALIPTSASDQITAYNHSSGTTDLIIDCSGYFA
ncbi:hypothetical protein [Streptacidiphilus sp. PAMC 29251]